MRAAHAGSRAGAPRAAKRARPLDTPQDQRDQVEDAEEDESGQALLEGRHPYGVKPHGNLLQEDKHGAARKNLLDASLGDLRRLDDAGMLAVLSRLPAKLLCITSAASRGLYVFSHHSNLWRDLTLRTHGGNFQYADCWKTTYIRRVAPGFRGHSPLQMPHCYSDVLYEPWMHAALEIDPSWLRVDNVQRRRGLSVADFIAEYETPGIPVILTDVMDGWAATREWTPSRLREKYADTSFRVAATVDMKMGDFLDYCARSRDERPLYLFERHYPDKCPAMLEEYRQAHSVCLSVCLSACLPVCFIVCLSVCLSVGRSVCLSVCLSVCRTVSRSESTYVCMRGVWRCSRSAAYPSISQRILCR